MYSYNSAVFGECVSAHRISVHILNVLDGGTVNDVKYATPNQTPDCSYGIHIDSLHNNDTDSTIVTLPFNIVTSQDSPAYGSANIILPIATVMYPDISYGEGVVLHPDFPVSEPIESITDPSILFQMDTIIDTLLPGYLPYKFTRYAA